jgi:hypothetical protein
MTAVLSRKHLQVALEQVVPEPALPPWLHVGREDIAFTTLPDGRVEITVRVTNRGPRRTPETYAVFHAAPLGAFVPWRPLTAVVVPALDPGQSFAARATARRPRPETRGDGNRVPPQWLLAALTPDENRDRPRPGLPVLPTDLMDLLGRSNPHWAGNLNIFLGGPPVERHMAQALRVYPGRVNLAMFIVGHGRDAYDFRLEGPGDWDARLYSAGPTAAVLDLSRASAVAEGRWVAVDHTSVMILALQPPAGCPSGSVDVHVRQQSTGQEAVVEFSLDPDAAGPGCYTL